MKTRDGYRATVGSRIRTIRPGGSDTFTRHYQAGATGTVMGLGVVRPGILMVHFDGAPIDELVAVPRNDVLEIHDAIHQPERSSREGA